MPVALFLPEIGPALGLSQAGVRFDMRQGHAVSTTRDVALLNVGDSTVNWTAEALTGKEWLSLGSATARATPAAPGTLTLTANPGSLPAGPHYALVRVSDPNALNSPHYLTAVLNVVPAGSPPVPDLSPPALPFAGTEGATAILRQTLHLSSSSAIPVHFQTSAVTHDGSRWLTIDPPSGETNATGTAQLMVTANLADLKPGIHTADVTVEFAGGSTRAANVTLTVVPAGSGAASPKSTRLAAGCKPGRLSLTHSGLANLFSAPASWPQSIALLLADDCGNPVWSPSRAGDSRADRRLFVGSGLSVCRSAAASHYPLRRHCSDRKPAGTAVVRRARSARRSASHRAAAGPSVSGSGGRRRSVHPSRYRQHHRRATWSFHLREWPDGGPACRFNPGYPERPRSSR